MSEPQTSLRKLGRSSGFRFRAASNSSFTLSHWPVLSMKAFPHFAREPRLGHVPVALHGCRGNLQGNGSFLNRQAAEKAQLDNLLLLRIATRKPGQRMVQFHYIDVLSFGEVEALVQLDFVLRPAFCCRTAPGVIHQNLPHELGRNRDKMGAINSKWCPVTRKTEVDFVNKLRTL
ncbi:hypothetical protein SBA5_30251 [Candidatus Sulfotelmatomonas gaucii]|uniref:Uncharacterized protein n=1 Tax=Candidatus Sulfuritelmatomonas gaucii TaxID=2043161 RepID=A0A2N9LDA7_9BACT|nr:hypothetical protein SBA5_30251 [Candidatus Sulfotelmatomonas gaucii]